MGKATYEKDPSGKTIFVCATCGQEYKPTLPALRLLFSRYSANPRYCSRSCANAGYYARNQQKIAEKSRIRQAEKRKK